MPAEMCIRDRYELTYDIYLNENRSSILQPLFNASVVTTRMRCV